MISNINSWDSPTRMISKSVLDQSPKQVIPGLQRVKSSLLSLLGSPRMAADSWNVRRYRVTLGLIMFRHSLFQHVLRESVRCFELV